MTQPNAPAGWYRDPTGVHELRYFNGRWTAHVCTQGVTSINQLTASPASPVSTPAATPDLPAAQSGPSMSPSPHGARRTGRRSRKVKLVIAGCVIAVGVGITLADSLRGGSGHRAPTSAGGGRALGSAGPVPTAKALAGRPGTRGNWTQSQWETVVGLTGSDGNHLCVDRALALNLDYEEVLPVVRVVRHHSLTASMHDLVAAVGQGNPNLSEKQAEVDAVEVYSTTLNSGCPGTV